MLQAARKQRRGENIEDQDFAFAPLQAMKKERAPCLLLPPEFPNLASSGNTAILLGGSSWCHVKSPLMNGIRSFPNSDPLTVLFIPSALHAHTCGHTVHACPRNVCDIQSLAALCLPLMLSSPGDQRPHSRAGH